MARAGTNNDLLAMALVGYEAQRAKINAAMAEIRAKLGYGSSAQVAPRKSTMSAAARKRIGAAQRKRWAGIRAQAKSASKSAPRKRKLSATARKKMGDATRKRWVAYRKAGGKKAKPVAKRTAKAAAAS